MSITMTLATARRILMQVRHDRRTLILIFVAPSLLLILLHYVFETRQDIINSAGLLLLGVFPFMSMFFVTSIAMVRERTQGTLERLLSTPMHKFDLLLGYGIAFGLMATVQASITVVTAYPILGLQIKGSSNSVILITIITAICGCAVGLLTSAFASTEFQALQFGPTVLLPQILLCGLFWPRTELAPWLKDISDFLPLTYAVEALNDVGAHPQMSNTVWRDLGTMAIFFAALLVIAASTLRRQHAN